MNRTCDDCEKFFQRGYVRIFAGEEDKSKCDDCVKNNEKW